MANHDPSHAAVPDRPRDEEPDQAVRFDPADPDKYRVDVHAGTIPFDWQLKDF